MNRKLMLRLVAYRWCRNNTGSVFDHYNWQVNSGYAVIAKLTQNKLKIAKKD